MKIEKLFDLTLREILEQYCTIYNGECGYYYGVFKITDVDQIFEQYNVEEYEEAIQVENLISDEIITSFEEEIKGFDKLVNIMNNLGISKKES